MGPVKHYFDHYFFAPLHWRLTPQKKVLCVCATCILSIGSLGLIPLGVGVYKLYQRFKPISITIPTSHFLDTHTRIMKTSARVFQFSGSDVQVGALQRSTFSHVMQDKVLAPFYRKKHAQKDQVLVPVLQEMKLTTEQQKKVHVVHTVSVIRYSDITKEQKIILNNHFGRAHNQITESPDTVSDEKIDEYFFTQYGQHEFLPNDPRGGHGCDHAVRASLLIPMFAYLYQKYHPDVSISEKEMLVAELVASLHDAGRAAEGTDVFDELTAELAVETLQSLGITDEKILHNAREAIANKDSNPVDPKQPKPLMARLVQNADSADFPRIFLKGEEQQALSFSNSRGFLDIYRELHALSHGDTHTVLKNELTYGDFLEELDALLKEKNKLAYRTHNREFREKASDPSNNYYEEVLNTITFTEYPHLHYVLSVVNVGPKCDVQKGLHEYREIARIHYKEMSPDAIERKIQELKALPASLMRNETISQLEKCKEKRLKIESKRFLLQVDIAKCSLDDIKDTRKMLCEMDSSQLSEVERTELAVVYQEIIKRYMQEQLFDDLRAVLHESALKVQLHADSIVSTMMQTKEAKVDPVYLHTDTQTVRKRSLRVQQKEFTSGKKVVELSFQLQSGASREYHALVEQLRKNPPDSVKISESTMKFEKKNDDGRFSQDIVLEASKSLVIEKEGITLEIGSDPKCYNVFNLVRVRAPFGCDSAKIQAFLAEIGLCHVLQVSRDKDIDTEFFNKVIQFRFPEKVFARHPKVSAKEVYNSLTPEEKAVIDRDMDNKTLSEVSHNHFEHVLPTLVEETKKKGGRGFITNIIAPNSEACANVLIRIVQGDLLSTTERYQNGIIGFGTCPAYNMEHGSANQAFTRLLTKGFLDKKYDLGELSYGMSKIFIVYGIDACERMPYSYPFDCGGMRAPTYENFEFKIHGFKTFRDVKGHELMKYRKTLADLALHIDQSPDPVTQGNEVMFDQALGSKYIRFIMVPATMRSKILELFKAHGIEEINGQPIESCIREVGVLDEKVLR